MALQEVVALGLVVLFVGVVFLVVVVVCLALSAGLLIVRPVPATERFAMGAANLLAGAHVGLGGEHGPAFGQVVAGLGALLSKAGDVLDLIFVVLGGHVPKSRAVAVAGSRIYQPARLAEAVERHQKV